MAASSSSIVGKTDVVQIGTEEVQLRVLRSTLREILGSPRRLISQERSICTKEVKYGKAG
jgi:hypothetical protein